VDQTRIFQPFAALMILTLSVWILMYARRIPFLVRSGLIRQPQITPLQMAQQSPAKVAAASDNLKNLFELPTIFYAVVLYLYATQQVDAAYLAASWIFFVGRVLHSAIHCTFNHIPLRFAVYVLSAFALWSMVLRAGWRLIS